MRMYDRTGLSTKCTLINIDLFRPSDPNSDLFRPFVEALHPSHLNHPNQLNHPNHLKHLGTKGSNLYQGRNSSALRALT